MRFATLFLNGGGLGAGMFFVDFILLITLSYLLVWVMKVDVSVYERLALSLLLALGIKSLLIFILIALGIKPELYSQAGLCFGFLVCAGVCCRRSLSWAGGLGGLPGGQESAAHRWVAIGILSVLVVLSFANAVYFPITETDGIWYHLRGMVFFEETRLDNPEVVIPHFGQYPPFIPLLYAYLISLGWERLKIIFPVFYLCLLVIFYFRVYSYSRNQKIAAVFTLILGTTPYLWWHSVVALLDLTAGVCFSLGGLYWFALIRSVFGEDENRLESQEGSLALLSGVFFGLASWARFEFVLYNAIPLILLVYALAQKSDMERGRKNRILLGMAMPALFFPTLWSFALTTFDAPMEKHVYEVMIVCLSLWLMVAAFLAGLIRVNKKIIISIFIAAGVGYFIFLFAAGHKEVTPLGAVLISSFRTITVHVFYSFTVFLGVLVLLEKTENLSKAEKLLGVYLLFYPLVHFGIFSYAEPKWNTLAQFAHATFVNPGNSVNLSDTRGMLAIYPVFVFFVSCLKKVRVSFENV